MALDSLLVFWIGQEVLCGLWSRELEIGWKYGTKKKEKKKKKRAFRKERIKVFPKRIKNKETETEEN